MESCVSLTLRQRLANLFRRMRLLQLADFFLFIKLRFELRKKNRQFREENTDACIPPAFILYDILGSCDIAGYFWSGKEDARSMSSIIDNYHRGKPLKILEWGCGPARVLQHLVSPRSASWELYGSDYNEKTIAWCQQNYKNMQFIQNQLLPPIPVESSYFDVVYCISVFTHLSEALHYEWRDELLRILKPGGLFIGTFHGNRHRCDLTNEERERFDQGQLVVRDKIREGKKNFSAYHGERFMRDLLAPFTNVGIHETKEFRQTVWCGVKSCEGGEE